MAISQSPASPFEDLRHLISTGSLTLTIGAPTRRSEPGTFTIRRVDVSESAAGQFKIILDDVVDFLQSAELVPFDVDYTPGPDQVATLELANFQDRALIAELAEPSGLPRYDPNEEGLGELALYGLTVSQEDDRLVLVRKTPQIYVPRGKRFLGLVRNGRVEAIDEPILAFDGKADVLISGSTVFIFNSSAFKRLFITADLLRARVEEDTRLVADLIPIANVDEFLAACSRDANMMTKLGRLARRDYLSRLTIEDVRATIDHYGLPSDLLNERGEFVYSGAPKRRWLILKILDDDYLESLMTRRQYEVNSKLEHRR